MTKSEAKTFFEAILDFNFSDKDHKKTYNRMIESHFDDEGDSFSKDAILLFFCSSGFLQYWQNGTRLETKKKAKNTNQSANDVNKSADDSMNKSGQNLGLS